MAKSKVSTVVLANEPVEIISYKGFNRDWTCRGFKYEVGATYHHDGAVKACSSGFHACEYPLDVFGYYPPGTSRYAEVRQSGKTSRDSSDSKIASATLTVAVELSLPDIIKRAVQWVFDRSTPEGETATGDGGAASSTGRQGAASSTGYRGAASSTGDEGAASSTGLQGVASSTGHQGTASSTGEGGAASSTGLQGAASSTGLQGVASSTGHHGTASSTGHHGAASSTGDEGAASSTGLQGVASSTGLQGVASSAGHQGAASSTGRQGAASSTGLRGKVMGAEGNALFLVYRNEYSRKIEHAWAGIAGRDGVKALVWYRLGSDGQPIEMEAA